MVTPTEIAKAPAPEAPPPSLEVDDAIERDDAVIDEGLQAVLRGRRSMQGAPETAGNPSNLQRSIHSRFYSRVATSRASSAERLRQLLAAKPRSGTELARELGVSQPTFSRLVRDHRDEIVVMGRARSARYALRRPIRDVATPIPVFEVDPEGRVRHLARLHPAGTSGHFVEPACDDVDAGSHQDLPYFLDALRPAGFLGRLLPGVHPELGHPEDIRRWSGDQTLRYAARYGWNPIGSLIAGEGALQEFLRYTREPPAPAPEGKVAEWYEAVATDALRGAPPGSSAAGEQPKFLGWRGSPPNAVLVKFSPPLTNEVGRRIADLLVAEHVALQVLHRHGHAAARSELFLGEHRLFLEIERFDRTSSGRRGLLSLEVLDNEFVGRGGKGQWLSIVALLAKAGVVPESTLEPVAFLQAFGSLIANTDMHTGNLSFFCRGTHVVDIAPAYDMTPMLYMPQQGHVLTPTFTAPIPHPLLGRVWAAACEVAERFWRAVSQHELVSAEFAHIAGANADEVAAAAKLARHLPVG